MRRLGYLLVLAVLVIAVGPDPVHADPPLTSTLQEWCSGPFKVWDGDTHTCTVPSGVLTWLYYMNLLISPSDTLVVYGHVYRSDQGAIYNQGTIVNHGMIENDGLIENTGTIYNLCGSSWDGLPPTDVDGGVTHYLNECGYLPLVLRE